MSDCNRSARKHSWTVPLVASFRMRLSGCVYQNALYKHIVCLTIDVASLRDKSSRCMRWTRWTHLAGPPTERCGRFSSVQVRDETFTQIGPWLASRGGCVLSIVSSTLVICLRRGGEKFPCSCYAAIRRNINRCSLFDEVRPCSTSGSISCGQASNSWTIWDHTISLATCV